MTAATHTLGGLLGTHVPAHWQALPVPDIAIDTRDLRPGALFLACEGGRAHGLDFLDQAREAGAAMVAWEPVDGRQAPQARDLKCFPVPGLRARLGELADRFFGAPSSRLVVTGVTGTNGKTSCAWLLASALEALGRRGAMIGTIGWGTPGRLQGAELTTPDVVSVHRQLDRLASAGARSVVMEVSSHALDQGRVDGVRFANALFTNLSRDHLDYHGDMAAYGEAKARLFRHPGLQTAAVSVDDAFGRRLYEGLAPSVRRIAVSVGGELPAGSELWVQATTVEAVESGLRLALESSWGSTVLQSRLLGHFNATNLLLVLAVLLEQGVSMAEAVTALAGVSAPPGRMEALPHRAGAPRVIVDFAHTPDALEKALVAARAHCAGALWCVFGAGGDRDRGKRPLMGEVAGRLADQVVITSDNPRGEQPGDIIAEIRQGIPADAAGRVMEIAGRAEAIAWAVAQAGPGDLVLIAGKGHEQYQQVGAERRPFSDQACAREALEVRA